MQVKINGKVEEISGGTVLDLLQAKKIEPRMVAVEVNDTLVDRDHLATANLNSSTITMLVGMKFSGRSFRKASSTIPPRMISW